VKIPSHTIGVMSTPNAGGTAFRIDLNKNSVGHATNIHGIDCNEVVGYQLRTIRHSYIFVNFNMPIDLIFHVSIMDVG
jgi:hypothetical protein